MTDREKVIAKLQILRTRCAVNPEYNKGLCIEDCRSAVEWLDNALALLKAQEQVINDMYSRYEMLCKEIREKYESDDVCGLCQYDGAYVGDSGDWMNECPGFETNDCFCMKNSIRKMCGQPLIEEP